ncbi:MAG: ATP synthase F1 subunit gamma [Bacteroidaceae bacterium]|nr:ATP synthase F1 subunit gamma [Bacteroidaceae bacterium]MBQ8807624.1 ATP synthase F1 subunit gamma [Bacteroidaceae bacterium]
MAALQEIKGRIASVQSTLKITSAMKMVASAKLHKTQSAAEALAAYSFRMAGMMTTLYISAEGRCDSELTTPHQVCKSVTVVAMSSDMSLCGGFNSATIRMLDNTLQRLKAEGVEQITIIPIGEKMRVAATNSGFIVKRVEVGTLADFLIEQYISGRTDEELFIYHHFRSIGRQEPKEEQLLPFVLQPTQAEPEMIDYIFEPKPMDMLCKVVPYCIRTRVQSIMLDNAASEHAARMVAMQTAADNAQELLDTLRLTYNKQRQQAITDELADITPSE